MSLFVWKLRSSLVNFPSSLFSPHLSFIVQHKETSSIGEVLREEEFLIQQQQQLGKMFVKH